MKGSVFGTRKTNIFRKCEQMFAESTKIFKTSIVENHRNANSDSVTSFYLLMINHKEFS